MAAARREEDLGNVCFSQLNREEQDDLVKRQVERMYKKDIRVPNEVLDEHIIGMDKSDRDAARVYVNF